ncbi:hypothetical protein [Marinicella meishanensis]|uniref:hypothetical protein n=1 Tax=Marinicella meishanensis TaxID=2873263 RepID=UPI001CBE6EA0|nr:hypothetical protein [Marinicella sp. NBU2979]
MGIIFLTAGSISFLVATVLGVWATIWHHRMVHSEQGGSWPVFSVVAVIISALCLYLGYSSLPSTADGEMSSNDMQGALFASVIMGAAPGLGLIFGALGVWYAREDG